MPSINRHRAGRVAQKIGQTFEIILANMSRSQGICCIRIPDGCRQVRGARGYQLLRVATPFDYVLMLKNKTVILDTKTTEGSTFTHSAIKSHQLSELLKCQPHVHRSGYLVWHRDVDQVAFYPAHLLSVLKHRQSLSVMDGLNLGSLSKMDITRLFTDLIPRPIDSQHLSTDIIGYG